MYQGKWGITIAPRPEPKVCVGAELPDAEIIGIAIIVCLSVAAVPAVLSCSDICGSCYNTAQVASFQKEYRLLAE
ncbi:hypothetical protein [Bradyrhizobium sp.]|uniref:hypothetical protein n=1 Tax=Bradyrhizobium sp. TaxID=376 RepID=UPI001ECE314A|nr:hypothetical protein [Bradyrhizobium sp.]MBV8921841.1 hypothetical protein [Bradyrhizobium sp.]MBV9978853.1 hypothetical protein [Bradyrhizobium sp.]